MADSAFWRDLADQFSALQLLAVQHRLRAASGATELAFELTYSFDILAMRGASAIAGAPDVWVWLEAVMKEYPASRSPYLDKEVSSSAEFEQNLEIGTLDRMCQFSATFCKGREAQAVDAEFEERLAQKGHAGVSEAQVETDTAHDVLAEHENSSMSQPEQWSPEPIPPVAEKNPLPTRTSSIETTICPRCESASVVHLPESTALTSGTVTSARINGISRAPKRGLSCRSTSQAAG
jgi:hypothetical protein